MPSKQTDLEYLEGCAKAIALMDQKWSRLRIFNEGDTGLSFGAINGVLNRETRKRKGLPVHVHSRKPGTRGRKGSTQASTQHTTVVSTSDRRYRNVEVKKVPSFVSALERREKGYTNLERSGGMPAPSIELPLKDIEFLERMLYR